jgi:Fur family ferric uptake transcriptional regulator
MDREGLGILLKRNGLFVTKPRLQVLSVLSDINGPISIENIAMRAEKGLAISTLYRVVADLLDANLVKTFSSPDQKLMVELSDDQNHHHHLYCESCEKVFDIDLDDELEAMINTLINKIGETHGIEITEHSFEMYGHCNAPGKHS